MAKNKNKKEAAGNPVKPKVKRRAKGEESFVEVSSASPSGSKEKSAPASPSGSKEKSASLRGSNPDDWEKIYGFCYEKLHLELMKWEDTGRYPLLSEGARSFTFDKGGGPHTGGSASMGDDTVKYGKSSKGAVELVTGSSAESPDALDMDEWTSKLTELENVQDCVDDAFVELVLQDKEFDTFEAAERWLRLVMVAYLSNLRKVGMYRLKYTSKDV